MKYKLEMRPAAREEFDDAADWYLSEDASLRDSFVKAVDEKLASITHQPELYSLVYGTKIRKAVVNKFPYSVYFSIESNLVIIHAIFHNSRNPMIWHGRLN